MLPSDINATKHFWDAFGHNETEVSASYIVRFCQERGNNWSPFTYDEINAFYLKKRSKKAARGDHFTFNRLIERGWIVESAGQYRVTDDFVIRCFQSSPARSLVNA